MSLIRNGREQTSANWCRHACVQIENPAKRKRTLARSTSATEITPFLTMRKIPLVRKEFEGTQQQEGAVSRMEDWLYVTPKEGEARPMTDFVGM